MDSKLTMNKVGGAIADEDMEVEPAMEGQHLIILSPRVKFEIKFLEKLNNLLVICEQKLF